jgi:hypothetical protein
MDLGTFLVMLASFTGAAVAVIGAIGWAIGYVKRLPGGAPSGQLSPAELDAIREQLATLEQRDLRVGEIEERLDFMERVLGRPRETIHDTERAPRNPVIDTPT